MAVVHKYSNVVVGDMVLPSMHYNVIKNIFFELRNTRKKKLIEDLLEAGVSRLVVAWVTVTATTANGDRVVSSLVAAPVSPPASPASAVVAMRISAKLGCRSPLASVIFA